MPPEGCDTKGAVLEVDTERGTLISGAQLLPL